MDETFATLLYIIPNAVTLATFGISYVVLKRSRHLLVALLILLSIWYLLNYYFTIPLLRVPSVLHALLFDNYNLALLFVSVCVGLFAGNLRIVRAMNTGYRVLTISLTIVFSYIIIAGLLVAFISVLLFGTPSLPDSALGQPVERTAVNAVEAKDVSQLAAAGLSFGTGDWWMFGHDPQHTSCSNFLGPDKPFVKWTFLTQGSVLSSPVIRADGTVYTASRDSNVYAVNPDGSEKWSFQTGYSVITAGSVGDDETLYIGSDDGRFYALGPNGMLRWHFASHSEARFRSPAAIADDQTIYIGCHDGNLYALAANGTLKWSFPTKAGILASPTIGSKGTIFVGNFAGELFALDASGKELWRAQIGPVYGSCAYGQDDTLYVGCADCMLYAFSSDGIRKWSYQGEYPVFESPAIGPDGTLYFPAMAKDSSLLLAMNPDGSKKWEISFSERWIKSPAVDAEGTVYVGLKDGWLYAIHPDGTEKWALKLGGGVASQPTIGPNHMLYVGSFDHRLYAIGETDTNVAIDSGH